MLKYLALAFLAAFSAVSAEETSRPLPRPALDLPPIPPQQAVFAGGCFWGMQAVFQHVKGVKEVLAGYSGGSGNSARYEAVSWGNTGHAEAVRILYDPQVVSFGRLLQVFFSVMDPTTRNYQGPDEGSQYRSAVFAADDNQRRVAEAYIAQLSQARAFSRPIVTEVSALRGFYPAEPYHQDYLIKHPNDRYIVINDLPKISALQRFYPDLYEERPVTVALRR
ncbi:peptide-methionine (S)-S-oxide reductase [Rhizomicrobium palustre]|uniref:Peptide methionine sulfoxide reductase MsrA n=1 Tax=Rhizomicrobium palustre TaxID=189966 RepID=A0A846MVZ1_9PROT|nr:peptide-methionine (S)-S-oxide reductase MsrA [Rhizomicrobium palustre]NIK87523.1 peptide-methionine (S)-S-oxide reductase [Rhizomicrobium palustre]